MFDSRKDFFLFFLSNSKAVMSVLKVLIFNLHLIIIMIGDIFKI